MAATDEAAVDLHGCAARLHRPDDGPYPHELRAGCYDDRAALPRPIQICRTFRSAPRKAARSAPRSSRTRGTKLISADYSQIELRVLAHIADIPQLRKAFADGLDIHAMTASEMFGVPIEGHAVARCARRAKAINFGIIYGISAFGLANQLGISREEAGAYIKTYFERFPGIRDYMDATKKFAARRRLRGDDLRPPHPLSGDQHQKPSACAAFSSAPPSMRRSRALPPTSSAAP